MTRTMIPPSTRQRRRTKSLRRLIVVASSMCYVPLGASHQTRASHDAATVMSRAWIGLLGHGGPTARPPHESHEHNPTDRPDEVTGRVRPQVSEELHMTVGGNS